MRAALSSPADVARFIHAGKATFTLESARTQVHFTYRVKKSEDGKREFLQLLAGPSNTNDFVYVGMLTESGLRLTAKSKISDDAPAVRAFRFLEKALAHQVIPESLHVFHEGKCGRCGRKLTVPESIQNGLGPECAGKA